MKAVEEKVLLFIAGEKLISKNDKVLVALSGGADSVFLLSFLKKFQKKYNLSLIAVHLNHKLRGKEADDDESFCKKFCDDLSVPITIKRKNVKAFAQKNKLSLEEAGREIRYKLFSEIALKENCTKIATAHHRSDNTETVLLNLIKGTGLSGASGIPPQRGKIIRPLLAVTKDEIVKYLQSKRIPFQIDSSNEENNYQRNFLRNKIVPLLKEKINPKLDEKLFNFSSMIKELQGFVDVQLDESLTDIQFEKKGEWQIPLSLMKEKSVFLSKEIIASLLDKIPGLESNSHSVNGVLNLFEKKVGAKTELGSSYFAVRDRDAIVFGKQKKENPIEVAIGLNEAKTVLGKKISIKEISLKEIKLSSNTGVEFISADTIRFPLIIRKWVPGDTFYPFGLSKPKKISEFLTALKLSSDEKTNQLLLVNCPNSSGDSEIVWVIKRRLDNRFAVTKSTKKIIKVRCN